MFHLFDRRGLSHHSDYNGNGSLIEMHDVVKTFRVGTGDVTVLKGINAEFGAGEFVGVIGKSGSGKSTLINMLTGIDRPTSGQVFVAGTPVHTLSESQLAVWRGRNLGIVFQFFQLLPMLSLVENVMLPMDFGHVFAAGERRKRATALLEMVGMAEHANKLPSAISGGEQQRVAIARALANDPPIIVADEPTGNLDSKTAEAVFAMFETLVEQGKTIVMVTHDSSLARRIGRTLLIADGEVVNEWVAQALSQLTHQQMLEATHEVQPLRFAPGQKIILEGESSDRFYIINQGTVEVVLQRPGGSEVVAAHMGPGQYFGEIELLRNARSIATIRASQGPVEAYALSRGAFLALLAQSDAERSTISSIVDERMVENDAARKA